MDMKKTLVTLALIGIVAVSTFSKNVDAQNCGCATNLCCSRFGFCGTGNDFCGSGCTQGPCNFPPLTPSENDVVVADFVTDEFMNRIINQAADSCAGKRFYTRGAFLEALKSFNRFGRIGSVDDSKREIAAFFGQVTHETGHFCHIEEIDGPTKDYCDEENTQFPCNPSKGYYGRGPIQLSWNFNYGPAGQAIGFDGLNAPETVANDPIVSFKTALWYWMNFVRPVFNEGFGATTRAINGALECDGANPATVNRRIQFYTEIMIRYFYQYSYGKYESGL